MCETDLNDEYMPTDDQWNRYYWAKWSAVDANGEMFLYSLRPFAKSQQWYQLSGKLVAVGMVDLNIDFRDTLRHRPKGI